MPERDTMQPCPYAAPGGSSSAVNRNITRLWLFIRIPLSKLYGIMAPAEDTDNSWNVLSIFQPGGPVEHHGDGRWQRCRRFRRGSSHEPLAVCGDVPSHGPGRKLKQGL